MPRPPHDPPPGGIPGLSDEAIRQGRSPMLDDMLRNPIGATPPGWSTGNTRIRRLDTADAAPSRPDRRAARETVDERHTGATPSRRRTVLLVAVIVALALIVLALVLANLPTPPR